MITIRVMAWRERACRIAHAAKATPGKSPSESDGELCRCFNKYLPSMLRASNSGRLRPCHHIRPHKLGHFPIYSQFHDLQNSNSQTALFKCSVIRMKESIRNSFYYSESMLNIFEVGFVIITWSSVAPPHQPSTSWNSELHAPLQVAF
jgi:hypothetical protein